jgi:hypothetical protein
MVPVSDIKPRAITRDVMITPAHGTVRGGGSMHILLSDLLLFSCLAVLVTGMVIVVASLLI